MPAVARRAPSPAIATAVAAFPIATLLAMSLPAFAADQQVDPVAVVASIEDVFGVNKGERRNHIKGTCAAGEFVGTSEARALAASPLFSGQPVPVIARFSLAGGNPKAPDAARSARGMALQFRLPDGSFHHMAMLNAPMFGAAHPQTFHDLMVANRPDPATGKPDPAKQKAFRDSHADSHAQAEYFAKNNPPASYASSSYWGIHTFRLVNADKKASIVRWQFVPQDGEKRLTDAEMASAAPNFLEAALIERAKSGPVRWDMIVSIGQPGDPEDNPTLSWPADRRTIKAGTLSLSSASSQKGAPCEPINFDPMVMGPGFEATNDPVLRFRSPAYATSFAKRLSGQ